MRLKKFARFGRYVGGAFSLPFFKGFVMNKKLALRLVAIHAGVLASASAFAVDPATAIEAVTTLSGSSTGFGPVMFGLAVTVVGIMIGVKWIKRAKGAA